jgi:GrpB-like predicted nucleotidyltransferase (UPF0157 family)
LGLVSIPIWALFYFTQLKFLKSTYRCGESHNDEVKIVEWNPKYPELTQKEADKIMNVLKNYLKEYKGTSLHLMGSTAIHGMPGKPLIDFTITTSNLLPDIPDSII